MSWPAVDELVRGSIQRSYLRQYRWWLELILDEFRFLQGLGYSLPTDDPAVGVKFHQKGNYIRFTGPGRDLVVEYHPESSFITADLVEGDSAQTPRFVSLDQALLATGSVNRPPARSPLDRPAIEATIRWWAKGLGANAAVLGPASSSDIQRR